MTLPKPKRNKMEIYNDILTAISHELTNYNDYHEYGPAAKPTHVQLKSNLAYDKFARYLDELQNKKMIRQHPLTITERGKDFLQDYQRIADFVLEMGIKYVYFSEEDMK
ncbi:MAG TPA: winged helix-turn-helix domain-containing protein [Nitrososphaeraceae archaeon]|nr:winged helix-turn-helix domain-containing protein [Nitrososphaeraceae archaeon]